MNKTSKIIAAILIIIIVVAIAAFAYLQSMQSAGEPSPTGSPSPTSTPTPSPVTLTISSTTSLHDTGLEDNGTDSIKTAFEAKYPWITVNFLAQGTGAAIQTAERGDADMVMVHDPVTWEPSFLTGGYGVNRKIIAYNFFVIVGPTSDPAHVRGMTPTAAMTQIYTMAQNNTPGIVWVSRNDSSGTYSKEKSLWKAAGLNIDTISQETWFKSTGTGMGQTLLIANEFNGYAISDTGTYLSYLNQNNIQLDIIVDAQKDLLNVYSVIADNPLNANLTNTHFDAEMLFIKYMVSDEGQQLIANYGVSSFGKPLFNPFIPLVSGASPDATLLSWIQNYAYIPPNSTECPAEYRYNATDLYSASYDTLPTLTAVPSVQLSSNVPCSVTANDAISKNATPKITAATNEKSAK